MHECTCVLIPPSWAAWLWLQVPETHCEDLEMASDEVNLKLALWEGRAEFDELVVQWRQTHFESLDTGAFEEAIAK